MPAETEILTIARTRDGLPVTEDLAFEFAPATPGGLAMVMIETEWKKRRLEFGRREFYEVEPFPADMPGVAVFLHRDPATVEADPTGTTRYGVLITPHPSGDLCECIGHPGCVKRQQTCKHTVVIRHLVETGRLTAIGGKGTIRPSDHVGRVQTPAAELAGQHLHAESAS